MKRCESRWTSRICGEEVSTPSRRRRRRSNLPITAVAVAGFLPHIPRARGGGRSPSLQEHNEQGPTQRGTLQHLFGIIPWRTFDHRPAASDHLPATSQEESIRRMPPFKTTSVGDGTALMLTIGVIRQVVTSSSTLNSLPLHQTLGIPASLLPADYAAVRRYSCPR